MNIKRSTAAKYIGGGFLTKALIYRSLSSVPVPLNKLAFTEEFWGFTGDRERSSSCVEIPSSNYKHWGKKRFIYGVTWLHFTALWH